MKKTALVIMAAGVGSRFGKIKKRPVDIIVGTESTFENKKSGIYPG